MIKLTELPTTPDGLPIGANGLPTEFRSERGIPLSGMDVAETMRIGRVLESIDRKPACGSPDTRDTTVLQPLRTTVHDALTDFDLQPRPRDPLVNFDIQPKPHDPLADFDISPKRRN